MVIHTCPRCGQLRSKARDNLCSVCYLLECLVEEHHAGEHEKPNPSCSVCKPRHDARLYDEAVRVSAQLRRDVLTSIDEYNHPTDTSSARQGRTQTPKSTSHRVAMSHASCNHERTPKARAKCRAERRRKE